MNTNRLKWVCFVAALGIMAGGAGLILRMQASQRLGQAGLRTSELGSGENLRVELPVAPAGFVSAELPIQKVELDMLPKDTSFGRLRYDGANGFQAMVSVVLMGTDRSSIHRPEFCLTGQGLRIDEELETTVPITRPQPYDLRVMKLTATKEIEHDGKKSAVRALYVYWFVSGDRLTARHSERMWWMAERLLRRGELERWAYVAYLTTCAPGEEEVAYERLKELIAATVPEFQLVTGNAMALP